MIENFPSAASYSIELHYSNGETATLGSSKVYIGAIFPQLNKLKMVKENGDIIIKVISREEIDITAIRRRAEFAATLENYNKFETLPAASGPDKRNYFRPLTITFETDKKVFYSLTTPGKLHTRSSEKDAVSNGPNSQEKSNALSSLEFLRAHIFKLSGAQE